MRLIPSDRRLPAPVPERGRALVVRAPEPDPDRSARAAAAYRRVQAPPDEPGLILDVRA